MAWVAEFWDGLRAPSGVALGTAAVIGSALALWPLATLGPADVAADPTRFAASTIDDSAFGTAAALRLASSAGTEPRVLVLGGSALREAVTSQEDLAARVASRGAHVGLFLLATADQTLAESEALVDLAPPGDGLVLVTVGGTRLAPLELREVQSVQSPRFGVDMPAVARRGAEAGISPSLATRWFGAWGVFLAPRAWFWARSALLGEGSGFAFGHFANPVGVKAPPGTYDQEERRIATAADADIERNVGIATALVELARRKGFDVVYLKTPSDPDYFPGRAGERLRELDGRLDAWAGGLAVPAWEPAIEAGTEPSDLYDWCHVTDPEARAAWTDALAAEIAAWATSRPAVDP